MAPNDPTADNLAELYDLAPLPWDDVRRHLDGDIPQVPGTGGPDHHTYWLATTDADGRPHIAGVGALRLDDRWYICIGPRSRKGRNIERDSRCALGLVLTGYDIAIEGSAARVTDPSLLARVAAGYAAEGWTPTVEGDGLTHEYSAPSAGPPPWWVYEITPKDLYAVATTEPGGATAFRF